MSARELFEAARAAREKSYSPYSGHAVGAAVRTADGRVFSGCNVENSSYGATICAERVAIGNAVSACGKSVRLAEVFVVTDAKPAWPPCGMCRQVVAEFGSPELKIHWSNLQGETTSMSLDEILPRAFTPQNLERK